MPAISDYNLTGPAFDGDLAELHHALAPDGTAVAVKIAKDEDSSDLLAHEVMMLQHVWQGEHQEFRPYIPEVLTTFTDDDQRVNVFNRLDGFYSLLEVMGRYPDGLDLKDAAWIWRRLLVALGYLHANGVVHGAVCPEHVLVHPTEHGLVLVDWCYSAYESHDPLPLVPKLWDHWVPAGWPAGPPLDIGMAVRTVAALVGASSESPGLSLPPRPTGVPPQMWAHLRGCLQPGPDNPGAWGLKDDFDELLERLYGPRKYRPLTMP